MADRVDPAPRPPKTLVFVSHNPGDGFATFRCPQTGELFAMSPPELANLVKRHVPRAMRPAPPGPLAKRRAFREVERELARLERACRISNTIDVRITK